jgi:hypothetical protein
MVYIVAKLIEVDDVLEGFQGGFSFCGQKKPPTRWPGGLALRGKLSGPG